MGEVTGGNRNARSFHMSSHKETPNTFHIFLFHIPMSERVRWACTQLTGTEAGVQVPGCRRGHRVCLHVEHLLRNVLPSSSYNPFDGPNENPEAELPLTAGKYLYVYGDMDEDGFYEGLSGCVRTGPICLPD